MSVQPLVYIPHISAYIKNRRIPAWPKRFFIPLDRHPAFIHEAQFPIYLAPVPDGHRPLLRLRPRFGASFSWNLGIFRPFLPDFAIYTVSQTPAPSVLFRCGFFWNGFLTSGGLYFVSAVPTHLRLQRQMYALIH